MCSIPCVYWECRERIQARGSIRPLRGWNWTPCWSLWRTRSPINMKNSSLSLYRHMRRPSHLDRPLRNLSSDPQRLAMMLKGKVFLTGGNTSILATKHLPWDRLDPVLISCLHLMQVLRGFLCKACDGKWSRWICLSQGRGNRAPAARCEPTFYRSVFIAWRIAFRPSIFPFVNTYPLRNISVHGYLHGQRIFKWIGSLLAGSSLCSLRCP